MVGTIKYLCLAILFVLPNVVHAARCLYVSSYHQGYEWNDGIEKGLEKELAGRCELKKIYLDTKRNPKKEWARWKAKQAYQVIIEYKPDVVIVSDDNASRYLVMPYLKNKDIPVVFCGLNWSMKEYGYPYKNVTGMIEIAPIKPLIKELKLLSRKPGRGLFLSSDVITEHKDYSYYKKVFSKNGIKLDAVFVRSFRRWISEFKKAQRYDFVFLGNNAGINDWYKPEAIRIVNKYTRKVGVTTYKWMLPYVSLALTKIPEEQGEWSAKAALAILDGMSPSQIPIVYNRYWDIWINLSLIRRIKLKLPYALYKRAKQYR